MVYCRRKETAMKNSKKTRVIAALLAICSIFTFVMASCNKTPDDNNDDQNAEDEEYMRGHDTYLDYEAKFDLDNAYYLMYSGNVDDYGLAYLVPNTDVKAEGAAASGFWPSQVSAPTLELPNVPKDLTGFDSLVMNVYSENATGAGFTFCINCQWSASEGKTAYKKYTGTIDWTGWKQIIIPINEMQPAYSPDLKQVSGIAWNASGWNNTPHPDSKLYFDTAFLTNMTYEYTIDIDTIGDYNYEHITETLVDFLIGNVPLDQADENTKSRLNTYVKQGETAMNSMNESGDPWNYDMSTTAGITSQYSRILQMAKAYAIEGSPYYKDTALMNKIRKAMRYMNDNYYGDQGMKTYPTRNNWWDWEIGSAQHIVNILMLCGDGFSSQEVDIFLDPVNRYVPYPSMTMANLVDVAYVCYAASALQYDAPRLVISRNKLDECMGYVKRGDGFYHDGSFIQHDIIPYTGSYGPILLEALSKLIYATNNTCFHAHDELINEQYKWAVDSFVPLMYHGAFYSHVRGRSICRTSTDVSLGSTAFKGMLRMIDYVDKDKANVLKGILKEYIEYNDAYYTGVLDPFDQQLYTALKADNSIGARIQYEFVKMFALMDRAVASLTDYGVGISLSSSRIAKYESINEENSRGWYTGDGMLYIYTTVDDYAPDYWRNVNMYRLPGTTVTTAPRRDPNKNTTDDLKKENISATDTLSKYDFVGGSYLGKSMVVAMQFESSTDRMKTMTKGIKFSSTLNGKKAWFVFDDEIVCLGAGIVCTDKYDTETVLDNRRLALTEDLYANGSVVSGKNGVIEDCSSIWFSTMGGIYLPKATDVNFGRYNGAEVDSIQRNKDVSFLELYINHGQNLRGESYEYVMLPTMTREETDAYCANPDVEILSNTASVQVARDKSSNTTGYVFWKAGTYGEVTVSAACTVIVQGNTVAVSDPTMKLSTLTVTVNGQSFTCNPVDGQTYFFTVQ